METLIKNIKDNENYENCEFLLLDYNSTDGLEDWVRQNLTAYLARKKLIFYRTIEPLFFHRAHALNLIFKLADGDILCNVDADNFTGPGFACYINSVFQKDKKLFLTTKPGMSGATKDVFGRICFPKNSFFEIKGYDESMDCYGFDDYDLKNRLELSGLTKELITGSQYLKAISHDDDDRLSNEYFTRFLQSAFVCHLSPSSSKLLLLFKDNTFHMFTVTDQKTNDSHRYEKRKMDASYSFLVDENETVKGSWHFELNNSLCLEFESPRKIIYAEMKDKRKIGFYYKTCYFSFNKIFNADVIKEIIMFYSQVKNRNKMESNKSSNIINVNPEKFGNGCVYKNFDYEMPILI